MMKNIKVEFTEKNLTGNAGLVCFGRFIKKLGLPDLFSNLISIERASNADYQAKDVIIMLIMAVLAGAKHMSHVLIIRADSVLRAIFNWEKFPVNSTFSRIFKLFSHCHCNELSEIESVVRKKVWGKKWFGRITFDMDSTVKGVFGTQEGAAKGYNPKNRGQKSYHPLLCFIAENRECLHSWFRTGDAYSANGSAEFMKECFAKIPKRVWKVFVRADSAFFSGELLELLEESHCGYTIKVKMKGLTALLEGQKWKKIRSQPGFESAEFEYKCKSWSKSRRFAAVRQIIEFEVENEPLPVTKAEYYYFCYVTNMGKSPWGTHKYYGKRSTSENWIDWAKNQMAAGSILTDSFWANSAIFQICILAYNLMVWMMWINTERGFREEPYTIRLYLIRVPGRLMCRGRQWFLRLEKNFFFKSKWLEIEESIALSSFP